MVRNKLNAGAIAELGAGNHPDGGNLYLRVIGGSRTYSFRFTQQGRSHWLTLGSAENWSLAEARKRARAYRRRLDDGADLAAEVKAAKAPAVVGKTFGEVAALYIEAHQAGWRSAKHGAQWQSTLDQHAAPLLKMPVAGVGVSDVLGVLEPIWRTRTETATRVRGRIEAILDYATARHWRAGPNPATWKGHLSALLPPRGKVAPVVHHAALTWAEMPVVMAKLASSRGTAARCVAFGVLTAARSAEARGALWREVDVTARVWTIPAGRMKGGREHRVPLSDAALAILAEMAPVRGESDLVFEGGNVGRSLSDVSVSKALHTAAGSSDVTFHGCRSTFRDWCGEAVAVPREVAEAALAHQNRDKVEAAYARSDLFERRRQLMADWAAHCCPRSGAR